jgi:hypothetical protein
MINLDLEPQQILLDNFNIGLQIVATIDMVQLLDSIAFKSREETSRIIGEQLLQLLENKGSLVQSIDFNKFSKDISNRLNINDE